MVTMYEASAQGWERSWPSTLWDRAPQESGGLAQDHSRMGAGLETAPLRPPARTALVWGAGWGFPGLLRDIPGE